MRLSSSLPPTCIPSQTLRNKGISSDVLLKMLFPSCGHLGNCSRRLGKLLCFGNCKFKMYFTDRPNVPFKSEFPHPGHTVFQLLLFQGIKHGKPHAYMNRWKCVTLMHRVWEDTADKFPPYSHRSLFLKEQALSSWGKGTASRKLVDWPLMTLPSPQEQ